MFDLYELFLIDAILIGYLPKFSDFENKQEICNILNKLG